MINTFEQSIWGKKSSVHPSSISFDGETGIDVVGLEVEGLEELGL